MTPTALRLKGRNESIVFQGSYTKCEVVYHLKVVSEDVRNPKATTKLTKQ